MQKMLIRILIIIMLIPSVSMASIGTQMDEYLNNMGLGGNYTSPKSWQDNSRNNYSLGSFSYRAPSKILQPAYVRLPEINAGCGGIDMHLGGLSFVGKDEFVAFGKAVVADAQGYALKAGLGLLCPSCEKWMSELQDISSKINNFSMNSCNTAKSLINNVGQKIKSQSEWNCALKTSVANGSSRDPISARKGCSNNNGAKNIEYSKEEKNEGAPPLNLIWRVLTDNQTPTSVDLTRYYEILMSMTGTVIYKEDGSSIAKKPIAIKGDTINILMNGGALNVFKCGDIDDCVNLSHTTHTIETKDAFLPKVRKYIEDIRIKLLKQSKGEKVEYTKEEENFVTNTPYGIPIVRIISIAHIDKKASAFSMDNIDEWIALSMTYDFLENMLDQVQNKSLFSSNLDMDSRKLVINNIKILKQNIVNKAKQLNTKFESVIQKIEFYDKKESREKNKLNSAINKLN
jgi:conjugative transfer pilus assembly protein TraH